MAAIFSRKRAAPRTKPPMNGDANVVDDGHLQCLTKQSSIGLAARLRAAAERNVLVERFDQIARLHRH
jgi:hypothetical protein